MVELRIQTTTGEKSVTLSNAEAERFTRYGPTRWSGSSLFYIENYDYKILVFNERHIVHIELIDLGDEPVSKDASVDYEG